MRILSQLRSLEELSMSDLGWEPFGASQVPTQADWHALFATMSKLPALRQFGVGGCFVGAAAAKSSAVTQLTQLDLNFCGVDDATTAVLAAGLKHLPLYQYRIGMQSLHGAPLAFCVMLGRHWW
jgi:hypothetical protein